VGGAPTPEPIGPEGAFLATITRADLTDPSIRGEAVDSNLGTYILSLSGGEWRVHQRLPDGGTWVESGSYTVDGSRLTLTIASDSECFGTNLSLDWSLAYATLSLTNMASEGPCSGDPSFGATYVAVFESHPWGPAL
jgi:hypothetical protein